MTPRQLEYLRGYELGLDIVMAATDLCDCDVCAWLRWSPFKVGTGGHDGWSDAVTGRPRQVRRLIH